MEEVKKKSKPKYSNILLLLVLTTLLFFGTQLIASILVQSLAPYVSSKNVLLVIYSFFTLVSLLLLLQFSSRRDSFIEKTGLKKVNFKKIAGVLPVLLFYLFLSLALTKIISELFPSFNGDQAQDIGFSTSISGLELVAVFVSLIVITPIVEEIIFRGVLFRGLRADLSFWPSAIITSAVFALAHAQWNVAIDTFALSLALCYLVEKSESIIPSILLHAIKNSLAFIFLFVIK